MRGLTRRGFAAICVTTAAAGGGYLLAAQTTAGAASPAGSTSASSSTPTSCTVAPDRGADAAASAATQRDVEQLARALGVSVERLGQATIVLKQARITPGDPRAAGILARHLGLDPGVVRPALDQMMSRYPFNQADATASRTAPAPGPAGCKTADAADCRAEVRPADANNPKTVALRGLARSLNVSMSRLMDGFGTTADQGVRTLDDPRMPAALAQALGLDQTAVRQAITVMRSRPPFDRASAGGSAAGKRK
jgi:hypothetical protein